IRCLRITVKVLKSRRDGLFIDQTVPRWFFLFFSGAENTPTHVGSHRPAPLKNKKKPWVRWLAIYKQAIPTGFGRSPKSKAYAFREENVGNDKCALPLSVLVSVDPALSITPARSH